MPLAVEVPVVVPRSEARPAEIGSRVQSATLIRASTTAFPRNYDPSFDDLANPETAPGTALAEFIVEGVLRCVEGYVPEDFDTDRGVQRIFAPFPQRFSSILICQPDPSSSAWPPAPPDPRDYKLTRLR